MNDAYLHAIIHAKTREQAALLLRARACRLASSLTCYSPAERLALVVEAEGQASQIERSFEGGPHPWRRWLREWGYPVPRESARHAARG